MTSGAGRPGPLRVAILGAGTVGREVVRAFDVAPDRLVVDGGRGLRLAGVAVRDLDRARASGIEGGLLTDAPAHLVASPDVDVVVELMGGDEPARTLVAAALDAGKAVVTANKHIVARHGGELEAIARRRGSALRFEAAVGGGIPVLGPLAAELASNRVTRIRGIVNGTTNAILSAMTDEGVPYADALAAAQRDGYAEADPAGDVEGIDAANKLAILCRLAFGGWVDPADIVRSPATVADSAGGSAGIVGIQPRDVAGATALGLAIKLVADARRRPDDSVTASVLATAVPQSDPLGRVRGVTNRIEVRADPLGSVAFSGPGAGGAATASAVLGDLLAIARGAGSTWAGLRPPHDVAIRRPGHDDTEDDRGWFTLIASTPGPAAMAAGVAGFRSVPVDDELAVHAPRISLVAMRTILGARNGGARIGGDRRLIFPVDERRGR